MQLFNSLLAKAILNVPYKFKWIRILHELWKYISTMFEPPILCLGKSPVNYWSGEGRGLHLWYLDYSSYSDSTWLTHGYSVIQI